MDAGKRVGWFALAVVGALGSGSCYDFRLTGPEDAPGASPPRLVSVTIEYRQPNQCDNSQGRCGDSVIFFGSWMKQGEEFALKGDPGGFIWRGVATGVPVNFPPRDQPHYVRVFDPHILDFPTGGVTAERLRIGGQILTMFDSSGTPRESGLIFVDENGIGHSPF